MSDSSPSLKYPSFPTISDKALRDEQTSFDWYRFEQFHGVNTIDEYRNLEVDNVDTQKWIAAQEQLTSSFLTESQIDSQNIEKIDRAIANALYLSDCRSLAVRGQKLFFLARKGSDEHCALYVRDSPESLPRLLVDPNLWAADGNISLGGITISGSGINVSADGKFVACGYGFRGEGERKFILMHVDSGLPMADAIGQSYTFDSHSDGLFYISDDYIWYHKIGTDYKEDKYCGAPYGRKFPSTTYWCVQSAKHERWIVLMGLTATTSGEALFCLVDRETKKCVWLFDGKPARARLRKIKGDKFIFSQIDCEHSHSRLVSIDMSVATPSDASTVIELVGASPGFVITDVVCTSDYYVIHYLKDAVSKMVIFNLEGKRLRSVKLMNHAVIDELVADARTNSVLFSFSTLSRPREIRRLDLLTGKSKRVDVSALTGLDYKRVRQNNSRYVIRRIHYKSTDGAIVTMYLSHHKNIRLDGTNKVLLSGYGGFAYNYSPVAQAQHRVGLELGWVIATACIRGGSENGEEWHQAGMKEKKQQVFDDFIAAGEWLIAQGYTSSKQLAILGGSNGGLLVNACLTQRPDLFGCVISLNGLADMLRYDKMTENAVSWRPEYGSPAVKADFHSLLSYSPLHRVAEGTEYPATMFMVGGNDDNVLNAHSFKFLAALQKAQGGSAPLLMHYQKRAGHGLKHSTGEHAVYLKALWRFATLATGDVCFKMPTEQ